MQLQSEVDSLNRQISVKDKDFESLEERYKEKCSKLNETEVNLEESVR